MGHYARGDSGKMICSSDEEEGYRTASQHSSRANSMLSQMNMTDKRNLILGIFGEASLNCKLNPITISLPDTTEMLGESTALKPPCPLPPVSDETDRQFWAEDELSGSESRSIMIPRRKRKHSVAYRNRTAIHRSRSGVVQSSSSSAEAARSNIPPSVRKRRRLRNGPTASSSRADRPRVSSSGAQQKINSKTLSRLASSNSNEQSRGFLSSFLCPRRNEATVAAGRNNQNNSIPSRTPSKSDASNVRRNRISKLRPPAKSRRNK